MTDRIKSMFKNLKIVNKINMIFIPLVLLPIIIIVISINYIYYIDNINNTKANIINNSQLISNQIQSVLLNVENCANTLNLDINYILENLRYEESESIKDLKFKKNLKTQINIAMEMFDEVSSITYIDTDDTLISSDINDTSAISFEDLYEKYLQNGIYAHWLALSESGLLKRNETEFYLLKLVVNIDTQEVEGILILTLPEREISDIYQRIYQNHKIDTCIIDENHRIISAIDKDKIFDMRNVSGKDIYFSSTGKILSGEYKIEDLNWYILSEIDFKYIKAPAVKILQYMILASVIAGSLAIITARILSSAITNPILKLKTSMLSVRYENLHQYLAVESEDEVGVLSRVYNEMLHRIHFLLEQVKIEQNKKREYEFALMQAQIKPHFLYNTLDLVYVLISLDKKEEARRVTKLLADFFRGSLSVGKEIIDIREECNLISHYLEIQKYRYSDLFDYCIEIDEGIQSFLIPKLSLQPLVENSIYHGLKRGDTKGLIRIKVRDKGAAILISVIDNGVGMEESLIQRILSMKNTNTTYKSFGIYNVNQRLKLYYEDAYRMNIVSEVGEGTRINITIKK